MVKLKVAAVVLALVAGVLVARRSVLRAQCINSPTSISKVGELLNPLGITCDCWTNNYGNDVFNGCACTVVCGSCSGGDYDKCQLDNCEGCPGCGPGKASTCIWYLVCGDPGYEGCIECPCIG